MKGIVVPKHIKDEVDEMRRHNAEEIKRLALRRRPDYDRLPSERIPTTAVDLEDRKRGRNGKLHINDIESIYGYSAPVETPDMRNQNKWQH